jgi:hypothetical protein
MDQRCHDRPEYGLRLYAGELITCENYHPFGRVMQDCDAGRGDWVKAVDWLQYTPHEGGSSYCNACGARWALIIYIVGQPSIKRGLLHVGDEWRPLLDDAARKHLAGQEFVDHE